MTCNEGITIVRGNDTNFNGANFLTINLDTEILDLSTFKAVFTLGSVLKTFDDISSGQIVINLTAQETSNLPSFINGVLQLIDSTNKIATIESLIPFKVISNVHGNAIATEPYTLNFDVEQGGINILNVSVESAVSVEVGIVTTLNPDEDAYVRNSGTDNHLVLDFGIPQGIQGVQGETGADGQSATITGASATVNNQVGTPSVTVTSGGTEFARSFNFDFKNLKGEQGIQGIQGIQGVSGQDGVSPTASVTPTSSGATITITDAQGTSTASITNGQDGADGTNATITGATASVSNTVGIPNVVVTTGGTESARSFNFAFTNLKGEKGDTGAGMVATVVSELPITGETGKLYLVPKDTPEQQDIYDEWIWAIISSNPEIYGWEHIGSTEVDLTGVVKSVNNVTPDVDGNVNVAVPVTDVQINSISILSGGVVNIPTASSSDFGVIKVNGTSYGIGITNSTKEIYINHPTNAQIDSKSSPYFAVTMDRLDYAVKVGVTTNTNTLTDTEKTSARNWIGAQVAGNYEQATTIQTLSATDSITLADNTIYNGGEITSLTIALPSTATLGFLCEIDFSSGTTASTLSYPNTIKWLGDDLENGVFVPQASKRYMVVISYDGNEYVAIVKGIE